MAHEPEKGYFCGTCNPGKAPKTQDAQRKTHRYFWCPVCQCARAFYPEAAAAKKTTTSAAKNDGKRPCCWTGCKKRVDPWLWGCKPHWFALPANIRAAITAAYVPGQESDLGSITPAWKEAHRQALEWINTKAG